MSRSYLASGNIIQMRFVKQDTTAPGGLAAQAGASDTPVGIAQVGTRQAPIAGLDDGFAAIQNVNTIMVFEAEDECWVEVGAAVTNGDFLKPSTAGVAITASSDGDIYGAVALENATASGQLVRCRVVAPSYRGA